MPLPPFLDKILLATMNFSGGIRLIFIAIFISFSLITIAPFAERHGLSGDWSIYLSVLLGVGMGICSGIGVLKFCDKLYSAIMERKEANESNQIRFAARQEHKRNAERKFDDLFDHLTGEQLDFLDSASKSNISVNSDTLREHQRVALQYLVQHKFIEHVVEISPVANLWRINPAIKDRAILRIPQFRSSRAEEFLSHPNLLREQVLKSLILDNGAETVVQRHVYDEFRTTLSPCFKSIILTSRSAFIVIFNQGYKDIFEKYLNTKLETESELKFIRKLTNAPDPLDTF